MTHGRLEHQTIKIRQLIDDYRSGRIVIPEFQREYVWNKSKAPKLIDSLYRDYPISSLLLWQSPEDGVRGRRAQPRPSRAGLLRWLVDGQQRVITLARAVTGDEGIDIVFHPEHDAFQLASASTRNDRSWIRIAELLDDDSYRRLRRNLAGDRQSDRDEARFERVRAILEYEVPVVNMVEHEFRDAVNAFERINASGQRLNKADIESARVAAQHSGFIADEVVPFLETLRKQGYTRLTIMHLFRACAFVAKPDGRNRTPLHELERREVLAAWKDTQRATERALGLVRSELGIINMDILWSGALLVPVIAICAKTPPKELDARGVIGWLALAALLHRYSGAAETKLDEDLGACRASADPVGALLKNLRRHRVTLAAEPADFAGALADRSALLALYVACMHRGILDFFSGGKVLLQRAVDRHHILPRAQFPAASRARADNIANIAFISGDVNKSIGLTGPEVYLKQIAPRILRSQCVPMDPAVWRIDEAEDFWLARRQLLAESFNDYLHEALPQRRLT